MITHFVEGTDLYMYGKFLVCRLDKDEVAMRSAMPDADGATLLSYGGRRRFNVDTTMVIDLQVGHGLIWTLEGGAPQMHREFDEQHKGVYVCPMYLPTVAWLYDRGEWALGKGDITAIPRYLELTPQQARRGRP